MAKVVTVNEIINSLKGDFSVLGSLEGSISSPASIDQNLADSIVFCRHKDKTAFSRIGESKARIVICNKEIKFTKEYFTNKTLILVRNPRLTFIQIIREFYDQKMPYGISPTAIISKKATIDSNVYIGRHCYLGDCRIGEGTIIYDNVYIYRANIGKNVRIHSGTIIGAISEFAYERNERGELIEFPHFGGVIIEDNVDIHPHVNIDRGTFGDTIIGEGSKINRYTHVGHNSFVGRHNLIGGKCFIAGSCSIGDYCEIAFCSCIRNRTKIGNNVIVGMGSVITKDVEDGWVVYGVPAKKVRKNLKIYS